MKMISSFVLAILLACGSWAAAPKPTSFMLFKMTYQNSRPNAADPFKDYAIYNNTFTVYSECAGEWIEVTQTVYFRLVWVENKNRSNSHVNIHREGKGIGLTSGTEYLFHGNYNDVANASLPEHNNQYSFSIVENFHLVTPGGGNILFFKVKAKYLLVDTSDLSRPFT